MIASAPQILVGVTGSHAYGLAGPDSDVDRVAVAVLPPSAFLGVRLPTASALTHHATSATDDMTIHDIGKFTNLCLRGNPTVLEALWLAEYDLLTDAGAELVSLAPAMLSGPAIKSSYMGYAVAQAKRAQSPNCGRVEKLARHALRLSLQGQRLWRTGRLEVRLEDPQYVLEFGQLVARAEPHERVRMLTDMVTSLRRVFDQPTALPSTADFERIDRFVQDVRLSVGRQCHSR